MRKNAIFSWVFSIVFALQMQSGTISLAQEKDSTLWVVRPMDVIPPVTLALAGLVTQGKISFFLFSSDYISALTNSGS